MVASTTDCSWTRRSSPASPRSGAADGWIIPASSARFSVAAFSQWVVTQEVAIAPLMVRAKFIRPEAPAVSSGSTLPSASPIRGTKKNGMPTPMNSIGAAICQKLISVVAWLRTRAMTASQLTPRNTSLRGSNLAASWAATGAATTASTPVIAVA